MGLSFLAPLFLAGLAALAIPVIVHLTHRERKEAISFPSLMFLSKIPYRTHRRQRIRHWLLFLIRSLAIVLLVTAFARPLLEDGGRAATVFAAAREVVVLLDHSHSMGYGDRWNRAVDAARDVVDDLGPDDRATLVLFAEGATAMTLPTADPAALGAAIDAAAVGPDRTRYGPALLLAKEILERSDRPRGEVVLISDFQRAGWDARQALRLPESAAVTAVDVSAGEAENLAVTGVATARVRRDGRQQLTVTANLANLGSSARENVPVSLEIEGQRQQVSVNLAPGTSLKVEFAPVVLPGRPLRAVIRAGDDPLPGDNSYHFVATPIEPLRVLIIEPSSASRDHSLYLRRVLGIGTEPGFDLEVRRVTRLAESDLTDRDVIILNDAPFPGGALGPRLQDAVAAGAGLLVVLGRRSPPGAWSPEGMRLLPAAFSDPLQRSTSGGGTIGYLDFDHPVLSVFREPRSGDFSAARFFRYRRLATRDSAQVLARFDDGAVALVERSSGSGLILVWASDVENFWNDLPLQPVFLPFIHRLVMHVGGYVEPAAAFRVGDVVELSQKTVLGEDILAPGTELLVESPAGGNEVLRPQEDSRYLRLAEPGFYEIRYMAADNGQSFTAAANLDPSESDLSRVDPAVIVAAISATSSADAGPADAVVLSSEDRERRQSLWWFLLLAAGLMLISETLLSNRLPQVRMSS